MATTKMTINSNNHWQWATTVTKAGITGISLKTKNTYIDKDIDVKVSVPEGSVTINDGECGVKEEEVPSVVTDVSLNLFSDDDTYNINDGILTDTPTSGPYIIINTDSSSATTGTVNANVICSMTAGYITNSESTHNIEIPVTPIISKAANKYIKIYSGNFEISNS